jgi:hypothetical protein
LIVPVPNVVPPLVIITVPVVQGGTVVVIVTGEPYELGPDVVTVTVGVVLFTVSVRFAEPALLLASPPYEAVIELAPIGSVEVVRVAVPFVTVELPRIALPLVN